MSLPSLDNGNKKKPSGLPSMPSLPDDFQDIEEEFEDVDLEDILDNDDEDNEEVYREVRDIQDNQELPTSTKYEEEHEDEYQTYDDYNPDYEEDVKKGRKRKFIDTKRKKIVPFGGDRSTRKVKSSEMDERKNVLAKTRITRFFILLAIAIMFLVGLKNTFLPSHVYNVNQIKQFARESTGQTGFPSKRGEAFVTDFMKAYLEFDRSKPELKQILAYYYGENMYSELSPEKINMRTGLAAKQKVIIGPTIYEIEQLTNYSALYKISAYVSNTDGNAVAENNTNGRWLSFAINIYYDENQDALAITKDSPSIIPTPQIAKQMDIPDRMPFGNGEANQKIGPTLNPTINGFIEAYAKASISSHESILQYISDKNDIKLYNGFGGSVELNGTPESAIKKVIYNTKEGIYRVDLTVNWIDKVATRGDNVVEYTAKYVMSVKPEGGGKYTVSSFEPYTFWKQ